MRQCVSVRSQALVLPSMPGICSILPVSQVCSGALHLLVLCSSYSGGHMITGCCVPAQVPVLHGSVKAGALRHLHPGVSTRDLDCMAELARASHT